MGKGKELQGKSRPGGEKKGELIPAEIKSGRRGRKRKGGNVCRLGEQESEKGKKSTQPTGQGEKERKTQKVGSPSSAAGVKRKKEKAEAQRKEKGGRIEGGETCSTGREKSKKKKGR